MVFYEKNELIQILKQSFVEIKIFNREVDSHNSLDKLNYIIAVEVDEWVLHNGKFEKFKKVLYDKIRKIILRKKLYLQLKRKWIAL